MIKSQFVMLLFAFIVNIIIVACSVIDIYLFMVLACLVVMFILINDNTQNVVTDNATAYATTNCIRTHVIHDDIFNEYVQLPYVIGVCGGTGSGKTTICNHIVQMVKAKFGNSASENVVVISQDSYYHGGNDDTNYDIPSSIDFELLVSDIQKLINGQSIKCPKYDFSSHKRLAEYTIIKPAKVIILEGILIFTQQKLTDLLKLKIFVTSGIPTMVFRRVKRDMSERGRTLDEIEIRYLRDVEDSYAKFVKPSERYANFTVNNRNGSYTNLNMILHHIEHILRCSYN